MSMFDSLKVKLGMAAPHMKPADVPPWGEFGWVVDQWYRLGNFWFKGFVAMTAVAGVGWYLYVDSETTRRPNLQPIHLAVFDHAGEPKGTYTSNQGEPPPNGVQEYLVKDFFFRLRRIAGSIDAVNDNFDGLTAYMGKHAETKVRACLDKHPVQDVIDAGVTREIKNMRYKPGKLNQASVGVTWTEIERDQLDNVVDKRDVEVWSTVRVGGQCPDGKENPFCIVIEEFSWDVPDC